MRRIRGKIAERIEIASREIPFDLGDAIRDLYTHTFEEKVYRWQGGKQVVEWEERTISTMIRRKGIEYIPRGSYHRLNRFLATKGYRLSLKPRLTSLSLPYDLDFKFQLYDYQEQALQNLIISDNGILQAPCGSGKTVIGLALINEIRQTTLILVHTSVIMEQWKEHLEENLGAREVGIIGMGKRDPKPITIAMVQTLHKLSASSFKKLANLYGCVIVDECHHTPAFTFLKVVASLSPKNLYGLTATPRRKDQREFLLFDFIGPTIYRISDTILENAKRITSVRVHWLTPQNTIFMDDWHHMITTLTNLKDRNKMIVDEVEMAANEGHTILILSERVKHCDILSKELDERGIRNLCITGGKGKKTKDFLKEAVDHNVMVATMAIAKEGLDLPQISAIVLATPCNNQYVLQQMIGRGRRFKETETLVIDIFDSKNPAFKSISFNRRRLYDEWNFEQDFPDDEGILGKSIVPKNAVWAKRKKNK